MRLQPRVIQVQVDVERILPVNKDYSEFVGLSGDYVALYCPSRDQTEVLSLKTYFLMIARKGRSHLFLSHRDLLVWDSQIYRYIGGEFLKMADLEEAPRTAASIDNIIVLGLSKNTKYKVYEMQPNSDLELLQTLKAKNRYGSSNNSII